jgi:hypothetical protein
MYTVLKYCGQVAAQGVDVSFVVLFVCWGYYLLQARTQRTFRPEINAKIKLVIKCAVIVLFVSLAAAMTTTVLKINK